MIISLSTIYLFLQYFIQLLLFVFTVKVNLQVSAAFVLLGILASAIAMILFCPLWHFGFFVVGSILAFASGVCVWGLVGCVCVWMIGGVYVWSQGTDSVHASSPTLSRVIVYLCS